MRFSGVSPPNTPKRIAVSGIPRAARTFARAARACASDTGSPCPRWMASTRACGSSSFRRGRERRRVDDRQPGRLDNQPRHRPGVIQLVVEAGHRQLRQVRAGGRMVPGELGPIVGGAFGPEQRRGARVVQMRVVQHREPGIPEQIRPEKVVVGGVAELVDGQIVRIEPMAPDELVRRPGPGHKPGHRLIHVDVDLMVVRKGRDQPGAARGNTGRDRGHGAEPGQAHVLFWRIGSWELRTGQLEAGSWQLAAA